MLTHLTLKSVIDINKGRIKPIVAKNLPRPTASVENVAVEPKPYEPPTNKNYDLNQHTYDFELESLLSGTLSGATQPPLTTMYRRACLSTSKH